MKLVFKVLAATAALTTANAASAQVSVSFLGGVGNLQFGETMFNSFNAGAASLASVGGSNRFVFSGSLSGVGAEPNVGDQTDPYLVIGSSAGSGSAIFNFAGASQVGLDYGSADDYNLFTVGLSNNQSYSFNGSQIINFIANGNQTSNTHNGRVTFNPLGGQFIKSLTITSSSAAAEIDNIGVISAVPEVGTWAMMLLGFGGVGFAMRRRTATAKLANA
jgi:hypothetical protein